MTIPPQIKNIIFDLGGVLLNVDHTRAVQEFNKLGLKNFGDLYAHPTQKKLFTDFETGAVSASAFRQELRKQLPGKISDSSIDHAWNAMLLDLPPERLSLLQQLKEKYRLFLLSNTNEIHITAFSKYLRDVYGFANLSHLFEKEYYSFHIGMRKPDPDIFALAMAENRLSGKETLFIDDSPENVESGKIKGLVTLCLDKGKTIEKEIVIPYLPLLPFPDFS